MFLLASLFASALNVVALVFIAVLLATAIEPLVGSVRQRVPILPRGPVILGVYLLFFLLVVVLVLFVVPIAIAQANEAVARFPKLLDRVEAWAAGLEPLPVRQTVESLIAAVRDRLAVKAPSPDVVGQAGLTAAAVLGGIGTTLAIVFFWLVGHARLQRYVLAFLPIDRRGGTRRAWNDIERRLGSWFRAQLILMGAVGIMCGVAYVVLGVPSALLLALIAALCEAIPMVGPILGAVPALLAALTVSPELGLAVALTVWIVQLIENHVLVPVVMRNSVGLSPLIVIVSLLVGGAAGGLLGAVVAVPVAAAIDVILGRLQDRDVPIAQDPSAAESAEEDSDAREETLPDARGANGAGRPAVGGSPAAD
jgi:predicted PurR-regulated permease PerM